MADATMNFYQDLPYTGTGGGFYDPGTPGVGGDSSGGYSSGDFFYNQSVATLPFLYQTPFITDSQKQALQKAEYIASQGFPFYGEKDILKNQRNLSDLIYTTNQAAQASLNEYNNVIKLPSTSAGIGLLAPDPYTPAQALPSDELSLLSEYNRQPVSGTPDPYTGKTYASSYFEAPKIGAQAAYGSWKNTQNELYQSALGDWNTYKTTQDEKYNNNISAALPKPFMPNGAPKTDDADLKIRVGDALARENGNQPVGLSPYNPLKSDWNGSYKFLGLNFADKSNPFSKLASQYDSPSFTGSGLLAQTMAKGMEGADPQRNSSNPWQSKNLIKPASYFDESSQGIAPPKGLMGQDMITQNNVLPALQMALMNNQGMPEGNEALDAATKPLSDAKDKGNATDKIQEARNKWKSDSLNKFGNWQSLA